MPTCGAVEKPRTILMLLARMLVKLATQGKGFFGKAIEGVVRHTGP